MEFLQVLLLVTRPLLYPRRNEIEVDDEEDACHFEAELTSVKLHQEGTSCGRIERSSSN
jgi:hypothetical protein